ncbi:hypothetical protein [Cardinium endosymbiont of Oedothorax gibbosus]|uniref:hypothetical protein n=1 Tax=Cardinium endosymbiont of Oedothorax gibbosus TaxID=931101 RepID=UPI00202517B2|nr:hypothetical protein [Cardinium endosymbiont of Oedothorax gibbosus]
MLYALSVIVGAAFLVFVIFNILVGDPTYILLGKYVTPESTALSVREPGLDRPWYIQYWKVLQSAFTFNFGYSRMTKQYILNIFQEGGLVSLTVTLPAFLIGNSLVISVALWITQYRGNHVGPSFGHLLHCNNQYCFVSIYSNWSVVFWVQIKDFSHNGL